MEQNIQIIKIKAEIGLIPGLVKGTIVCADEAFKQSMKNEKPDSIYGNLIIY